MGTIRTATVGFVIALIFFTPSLWAATGEGGLPGSLLRWGGSARCLALGGAFVGLADDATAVYWNPAGLEQVTSTQLLAMHAFLFEGTNYDFFALVQPARRLGTFALGGAWLSSGGYERTNEFNISEGKFSDVESAYWLSFARGWGRFSAGLNLKIIHQKVAGYAGSGTGLDLSFIYYPLRYFSIGMTAQNVIQPKVTLLEEEEIYPRLLRLGNAIRLLDDRLILATDLDRLSGRDLKVHTGVEWWTFNNVALRGGYDGTVEEYAVGAGYRLGKAQIDYSLIDHPLGFSHRFSILWRFGVPFGVLVNASHELFSPTGKVNSVDLDLRTAVRHSIDQWEVIIEDGTGTIVKSYRGDRDPPGRITWPGDDEQGRTVDDGLYAIRATVVDNWGNRWSDETEVRVVNFREEDQVPVKIQLNVGKN